MCLTLLYQLLKKLTYFPVRNTLVIYMYFIYNIYQYHCMDIGLPCPMNTTYLNYVLKKNSQNTKSRCSRNHLGYILGWSLVSGAREISENLVKLCLVFEIKVCTRLRIVLLLGDRTIEVFDFKIITNKDEINKILTHASNVKLISILGKSNWKCQMSEGVAIY